MGYKFGLGAAARLLTPSSPGATWVPTAPPRPTPPPAPGPVAVDLQRAVDPLHYFP